MHMIGNTILITGGGSGIGRGLAEKLHVLGNHVIIAGRRQSALDEVTSANPGIKSATLDIENAGAIQEFAGKLLSDFPALNVVIHNAGIMRNENLLSENFSLADAEATITTNLLGPIRLTAALLPHLVRQKNAAIMTVTSGLAFTPLAMTPTYCATKAAIHSYTESLRYQLRDTGVSVLELAPPYVQTTLMGHRQQDDPAAMPLSDFLNEVVHILSTCPDATEILVERVKPLRYAASSGNYDVFFKQFNDHMLAARHAEF